MEKIPKISDILRCVKIFLPKNTYEEVLLRRILWQERCFFGKSAATSDKGILNEVAVGSWFVLFDDISRALFLGWRMANFTRAEGEILQNSPEPIF